MKLVFPVLQGDRQISSEHDFTKHTLVTQRCKLYQGESDPLSCLLVHYLPVQLLHIASPAFEINLNLNLNRFRG